ncbi:hypothetical protein Syun_014208 [Stephania yunnanensis]|uniref:Uncharacterized protein n=1 Tax=Stephania yunnanensis TaxID=152371 RepID=A0AAP0JIV6_9MAGN
MCFIRGAVDIPHSRHFRYGDAASDDRVCLALPRLYYPDPVAPAFGEENVNVDTLRNVEVNVDTPVENYWCETTQGLEVLQIESDISIAQNDDDEAAIEIGVISERPAEPQIERKEDQPLVLVKPPTLPCIFVKPYTGVEVKERSQIFYTANTFMLDDHDITDSFMLEVLNELPILKEGLHAALPKYVDASFVVDISKGEGIT